MPVDYVSFGGWKNNLRLADEHTELIVTLDVGPRVISYRTAGASNVFKTFDAQLGGTGESEWQARGGHRFWLAPEDEVLSYIPDNSTVEHHILSPSAVELITGPSAQLPIRKVLTLALEPDSSRATVTHRAENHGDEPVQLATWGVSVMRPGGIEIIPLPPLGQHPRDLLPERKMILWPYTSMADPRWQWGERFITLRQADTGPTKVGLTHREGWVAYHCDRALFLKTIQFEPAAIYPDGGCNFETFSNEEMLEVEALGPLVELAPGEATGHVELWQLFDGVGAPPDQDNAIAEWMGRSTAR